jgi:hypothetical protein
MYWKMNKPPLLEPLNDLANQATLLNLVKRSFLSYLTDGTWTASGLAAMKVRSVVDMVVCTSFETVSAEKESREGPNWGLGIAAMGGGLSTDERTCWNNVEKKIKRKRASGETFCSLQ